MILLNAIVVVLNETVEAGILISVLLSISHRLQLAAHWWRWGLLLGCAGSLLYAHWLPILTEWFDYGGQEVVNSSLQLAIFALAALLIHRLAQRRHQFIGLLLALAMGLAMIREGAEIVVFYLGITSQGEPLSNVLTSSFVGAAIGASIGALLYYFLMLVQPRHAESIQPILLAVIASGMVLQASQLLIQIDWLPVTAPLWNSSALLSEQSPLGQLAYAVFGYEATPSAVEAALYASALLLSGGAMLAGRRSQSSPTAGTYP